MEFLGSVDPASDSGQPDDAAWLDYLSRTDIGKVAKPDANAPSGAKPAASAAKPDTSGVQHQ